MLWAVVCGYPYLASVVLTHRTLEELDFAPLSLFNLAIFTFHIWLIYVIPYLSMKLLKKVTGEKKLMELLSKGLKTK